MRFVILFLICLGYFATSSHAELFKETTDTNTIFINTSEVPPFVEYNSIVLRFGERQVVFSLNNKIPKKLVAIGITVLTGAIGGHRLYLGTSPVVPIVYALTLGGGFGILPLIDLIAITATKDLSKYENNSKIIMWAN